jgi:ferric iron reductase protein FhuF
VVSNSYNSVSVVPTIDNSKNTAKEKLVAVPIQNGYKLENSVSEVIYELLATSIENVFTAKKGSINGTFLKKNTGWFFEYYQNNQLISEKVEVKF